MRRVIGCYTNCYGAAGVREAANRVRSAGIDHLELAMRGHDFGGLVIPVSAVITEESDAASVREFQELLKANGVGISGCNVGGGDLRTPEGVEKTANKIRRGREWFGAALAITGVGQPADDAERRLIVEGLKKLGDVAQEIGVTIALETHKGPTENAAAMLRLMDEVDHPAVRLNFDTGNIGYYNKGVDPVDELEKVKHLVRNVHLKDSRGGFEDWYFPAIGDGGSVDFRRVREIMDGVGFTGPYTIEIEGIGGEPEPGPEGRHDRVVRSVEHLRSCGYFED